MPESTIPSLLKNISFFLQSTHWIRKKSMGQSRSAGSNQAPPDQQMSITACPSFFCARRFAGKTASETWQPGPPLRSRPLRCQTRVPWAPVVGGPGTRRAQGFQWLTKDYHHTPAQHYVKGNPNLETLIIDEKGRKGIHSIVLRVDPDPNLI